MATSEGVTILPEQVSFEVLGSAFRVDKKYSPIKALGKGAFGVVCACKNRETGAKVAVKKTSPMAATKVDSLHALRELRLLRWLGKHPNILSLKDIMVDLESDTLYIVAELMDTDLHRIIQSTQPLGDAHFKHFMFQLFRGLRYAHSYNVIHRDLKPANLLVTKNCDLVISDFGLARMMPESSENTMTEHVVTRWYRAPELMLSADGHYTLSVDMWSAGCVFAELLGRTPLFAGKDFMETITMQINVLGTRPPEELAYIKSDQALAYLEALPHKHTIPWSTIYPEASEKALDLLDKLLQFHPAKRITAEAAMAHPYFDSVRSQYTDPEPVLPLGPGGFEFSFEGDVTLSIDDFKRLIVLEASSLRAEKAIARRLRAEKLAAQGLLPGHSLSSSDPSSIAAATSGIGGGGEAPARGADDDAMDGGDSKGGSGSVGAVSGGGVAAGAGMATARMSGPAAGSGLPMLRAGSVGTGLTARSGAAASGKAGDEDATMGMGGPPGALPGAAGTRFYAGGGHTSVRALPALGATGALPRVGSGMGLGVGAGSRLAAGGK